MKRFFIDEYDCITLPGVLSLAVGVIAGLIGLCIVTGCWSEVAKCGTMRDIGFKTMWTFNTGCLVQYKGDWTTADAVLSHQYEVRAK